MSKITCLMCDNFDEKSSTCLVLGSYVGATKNRSSCVKLHRFVEKRVKEEVKIEPVQSNEVASPVVTPDQVRKVGFLQRLKCLISGYKEVKR